MGLPIQKERFEEADYLRFSARLRENLAALRELLERPGFGVGPATIGAELEMSVVGRAGRPLPINRRMLADTSDPRFTLELDRFNLECNTPPLPLAGNSLSGLTQQLGECVAGLQAIAGAHAARVVLIGIVPTLEARDLRGPALTDLPRYRALSRAVRSARRKPFQLCIAGDDPLDYRCDDVTCEGANTSLQIHLRVDPARFTDLYNAVQLATAPVLAVAGNSPLFLGHRLWEETRIALFKQAVDDRARRKGAAPRVGFGQDWLQRGALELFEQSVEQHAPLLPVIGEEDSLAVVRSGGVPRLEELRLHQSTVWRWNRAVYDPHDGGHVRIEMRALPSGPTLIDMAANAGFLLGLGLELAQQAPAPSRIAYASVHANFYRAAQHGLAAVLQWPDDAGAVREIAAAELVPRLLPLARRGLIGAGVDAAESERFLAVIEQRAASGQTGAQWQRRKLAALEATRCRKEALARMLHEYLALSEAGAPVHRW